MKVLRSLAAVVFLLAVSASLSMADVPGRHPAYLHALSDLRDARAHLEHMTPSEHMNKEEQHAIEAIDRAIDEIKKASIDDGKNIQDHVRVDAHLDRRGRYHKALELLNKAHNDVAREEDNRFADGLRDRAVHHIDEARNIVDRLVAQARD
ncbi:MAG: hypothetical protein ABSG70_03130 [Terriglobales bacterium]|jgi:tetratricopeptide (TPR) repeat protein